MIEELAPAPGAAAAASRLSFREKLAYGLGDTASSFVWQTCNFFLTIYYTDVFGPRLFTVPYIIPLAWSVIVYLSYVLANLMVQWRPVAVVPGGQGVLIAIIGAAIVTAYDLALDPFMVRKVGAWVMINPGNYFGEQFRGFAGWMLVAFTISWLFRTTHQRMASSPPARITTLAAAYPLLAYSGWWVFFTFAGFESPGGIRCLMSLDAIVQGLMVRG